MNYTNVEGISNDGVYISNDEYLRLKRAYDILRVMTTCNDCRQQKNCLFAPKAGEVTRFNCSFFVGGG